MKVPFPDVAKYGVIKDLRPQNLPLGAWSDGKNIGFADQKIQRGLGYSLVFDPPTVPPYWALSTIDTSGAPVFVYAGLAKVYCVIAGVHTEITKASGDYTGGADDKWTGGNLAAIPILNNGVDKPQFWAPTDAGTKLQDLTAWPATHTAKILRPFKNFLVAMNITEGGTKYAKKVRVSHPASPGAVPASWDETDATKDVRTFEFTDWDAGEILDGVPLKDTFVFYSARGVHGMVFSGGSQKWRNFGIFEKAGILATNCACPFDEGSQHFVKTQDDLIIHNGQTKTSIITQAWRKWLQDNISSTNYKNSFCFSDTVTSECSFCFPSEGATYPDLRLVYNWKEKTLYPKDMSGVAYVVPTLVEEVSDTWEDHSESWDSNVDTWDTFTSKPFLQVSVGVAPLLTEIHQLGSTNLNDGSVFTSTLEKIGIDVMGVDRYGHLIRDRSMMKLVHGLWIRASGAPFQVQIGRQLVIDGPIVWSSPKTFMPGVNAKVDFNVRALLYGIRFTSTADGYWEIDDFDVDVDPTGQYGGGS